MTRPPLTGAHRIRRGIARGGACRLTACVQRNCQGTEGHLPAGQRHSPRHHRLARFLLPRATRMQHRSQHPAAGVQWCWSMFHCVLRQRALSSNPRGQLGTDHSHAIRMTLSEFATVHPLPQHIQLQRQQTQQELRPRMRTHAPLAKSVPKRAQLDTSLWELRKQQGSEGLPQNAKQTLHWRRLCSM